VGSSNPTGDGDVTPPEQSVVGFAAVFIPLNDDGLRSDAVPTAGLEVSF